MKLKSALSFLILAASASSFAQNLPPSQCPVPNVLLSRDYVGLSSESVDQSLRREGNSSIPLTSEFSGTLKARVYKVFEERSCVPQTYSYQLKVCTDISPELALGRGNDLYRSFYDLNITTIKRADMFARTVRFGVNAPQSARLNTASELVRSMTRLASVNGVASSWEGFVATIKKIQAEALITQADYDDLVVINGEFNRNALGFKPLAGVQSTEARGNGKLGNLFDLNAAAARRAGLIRATIAGVSTPASHLLAASFISFASVNGIPSTWNQFVLLMRDAVAKNAISPLEFVNITEELEFQNRANLGFDINFFTCRMENRLHYYNSVAVNKRNEFNSEVSKNFRLSVVNGALLSGEREIHLVSFHGLNGLSISTDQEFNSYGVEKTEEGDVTVYKINGARRRVSVPNSIVATVLHAGKKVDVALQNTAFNPLIGGKVVVEVHFFEKVVILKDKDLGIKTFEVIDGNKATFAANIAMIKATRPAYVEVRMKIVGSPYYNEGYSSVKEFKEVK